MRPERLCRELTEVLPKDAILVADTGYAALWTGTLVFLRHPTQRYLRAAGSLGWSFPASLGAKCARARPAGDLLHRRRRLLLPPARTRDGAPPRHQDRHHRQQQPLPVARRAQPQHRLRRPRPRAARANCYEYRETDFARVAQSFDCLGITVEKPQDFREAFERAMASELPAVIDVKTEFASQATAALGARVSAEHCQERHACPMPVFRPFPPSD